MAYDIITINPTTVTAAYADADLFFDLTKVELPARACKLVSVYMEVAATEAQVDDVKIGLLFFKKNTNNLAGSSGAVHADAEISAADFTANKYIGSTFLQVSDGSAGWDLDIVENVALFFPSNAMSDSTITSNYIDGSLHQNLVLKGDAGGTEVYVGGVLINSGSINVNGTDTVKIHFHVEY